MARAPVSFEDLDAVIFDLDGVVTNTATIHAAAWKALFDEYLQRRTAQTGEAFRPFDIDSDYPEHIDGKPRYDGVAAFLRSRGITPAHGNPDDPPDQDTLCGLGNRKNDLFHDLLRARGVEVYPATVALARALKARGRRIGLVTSSRNGAAIVEAAGLTSLFDIRMDGNDLARLGLPGKPAPDLFIQAARRLGAEPARTAIVEDATVGVEAGRRGGFGLVIGVDRAGQPDRLRASGADLVVSDLEELNMRDGSLRPALDGEADIARQIEGRELAVFLDYDGTLTPIVARPELAVLPEEMRTAVSTLAARCTVAIVSGRDRADVERLVRLPELVYAGSHGFDIASPARGIRREYGAEFLSALDRAEAALGEQLSTIDGSLVERKRFSVAVHYRNVADADVQRIRNAVQEVAARHSELRVGSGKKVHELQPDVDWHKGRAVLWLLESLGLDPDRAFPVYIGDDVTDEDAFAVVEKHGLGVLVADTPRPTAARMYLRDTGEVRRFLEMLSRLTGPAS
jgi:trehalose-phosphatase